MSPSQSKNHSQQLAKRGRDREMERKTGFPTKRKCIKKYVDQAIVPSLVSIFGIFHRNEVERLWIFWFVDFFFQLFSLKNIQISLQACYCKISIAFCFRRLSTSKAHICVGSRTLAEIIGPESHK